MESSRQHDSDYNNNNTKPKCNSHQKVSASAIVFKYGLNENLFCIKQLVDQISLFQLTALTNTSEVL